MESLKWPRDVSRSGDCFGGKAAGLAALTAAGLPVPMWFAVEAGVSREEVDGALDPLCSAGDTVAVRSSWREEDGARHSFAGQFQSFLFVEPAEVYERISDVLASGDTDQVRAYRRLHGLRERAGPPAVIVQRMVNPDFSGVAFSSDPVSGRRGVVVVAIVRGPGDSLVGGDCNGATYRIDRNGRVISRPHERITEDETVGDIAALALRCERLFQRPQDVEWAIQNGRLWILQSRPITGLAKLRDPDGAACVWDNSNIVESYGGVVSPLTFSFARRAYEEVYRQFCRMMWTPAQVTAANAETFRNMIGLVRGRVYYNLRNWYRVLSLLPGYSANRAHFEQMLGVTQSLADVPERVAAAGPIGRALAAARGAAGVAANYILLPRQVRRFRKRLAEALGDGCPDYAGMRPEELAAGYRELERRLLTHWDAPIANDFFCMIFSGLLRRLAARWLDEPIVNDLLVAEGGLASAEPARLLGQMATVAARDPVFVRLLDEGDLEDILPAVVKAPGFDALYREWIERFGDRCLEELKLESATVGEDPLPLMRAAARIALRPTFEADRGRQIRLRAEEKLKSALRLHPLRRAAFAWVLANARRFIRGREEMRFERTRLFGRVRRIFVELGRRLYGLDLIADPRDIFYLEVEEALGFVAGTATCTDLRGLIALRKAEYERFGQLPAPARRFETLGIVHHGNSFHCESELARPAGPCRKGVACCPGIVRGRVRVIADPRRQALLAGEILVAERTDPGWIVVLPTASGIIVENGSVLSHSAIVARELGIPAVVALEGATQWLQTGDDVQLDGASGEIVKVSNVERCA